MGSSWYAYPADKFCKWLQKRFGPEYTVKWHKKSSELATVEVIANYTGQSYKFDCVQEYFRAGNEESVATMIHDKFFNDATNAIERGLKTGHIEKANKR